MTAKLRSASSVLGISSFKRSTVLQNFLFFTTTKKVYGSCLILGAGYANTTFFFFPALWAGDSCSLLQRVVVLKGCYSELSIRVVTPN